MFIRRFRLCRDESAVTAAEYAVLLGLILVVVIAAISALGNTNSGMWATDTSRINSAMGGS
jgi:Flp pilus assembly pilin Flp